MDKDEISKTDQDDGSGGEIEGGDDATQQVDETSSSLETEELTTQIVDGTDLSDDAGDQGGSSAVELEGDEAEIEDDVAKDVEDSEDSATVRSELYENQADKVGGSDEMEDGTMEENDSRVVEEEEEDEEGEIDEQIAVEDESCMPEGEEEEEEMGMMEDDEVPIGEDEQDSLDDESGDQEKLTRSAAGGMMTRKRTMSQSSSEDGPRRKVGRSTSITLAAPPSDGGIHDRYCWVCHKEGVQVNCKLCPRSYHSKCMTMDYPNAKISQGDSTCPCPECVVVMNAETIEFRSEAMKQMSLEQLMSLLKNICQRMRKTQGADPFIQPVDPSEAEDYFDYIVYPMDIETLEKNIKKRQYGSTEAFLADAQWLVHNSIVFNSASSHYTVSAKRLLKVCKQELTEIETCPECYTNAHDKPDSWFVEACRRPHLLVWAKLKGFPFWPAKAMKVKDNDIDVRFFGQHDRAWVTMKDCFLYSEEMPVIPPKKNGPLVASIEELTAHVDKLRELHGTIRFATVRTPIGPSLGVESIRRMIPEYNPPEQPNQKANQTTPKINSSNKVAPPKGKSPMTIRISSLKTNPTIVNNTAVESPEGRVTRLTRKSSAMSLSNVSNESDMSAAEEQITEDKPTLDSKPVPEKKEAEEDASVVPKGEILASALGLGVRRSTRGSSRSGDSSTNSTTHQTEGNTSATPTLEKRLTRGSLKVADVVNESGNEGDGDAEADNASDEQPPDSVLEAMGLSKKTKELPTMGGNMNRNASAITIKGEPHDTDNDDDLEEATAAAVARSANNKSAQSLMEQLSAHTNVKPGYRFNLSKDISISAVDGGDHNNDHDGGNSHGGHNVGINMRIKRSIPNAIPVAVRAVPQGIPMAAGVGVGATRPRLPLNPAGAVNGGQQRTFTGQQLRQMVRNARPQQILNPRTGARITGNATRPVAMMSVRGQQQNIQKNTKEHQGVVVDSTSLRIEGQGVNPVPGPITLPGGTITVTPLTSILSGVPMSSYSTNDGVNGPQTNQVAVALKPSSTSLSNNIGIINVQQQQSGGTTIVNNVATGGKAVKAIQPAMTTAQQRRNLMVSIPPSVNMHLQNLTKTMGDLVKSTVEQITLEVLDHCNNAQGKVENSRLQLEVDRLQSKLKQEVTDVKHNNDIAMRELRMTMENDKKRAVAEMKRQMESEKQKAIEETKKKQWCASCGREALFYCCWNTSYCGYPCQEEHWPTHMSSCSQGSTNPR